MSKRHDRLGFKHALPKRWMDYVVNLMISGLSAQEIRAELKEYLSCQKPNGEIAERGKQTYLMVISLLASWFDPDQDLVPFRDKALKLIREYNEQDWLPFHWAIISASYPFWFEVAKHAGRLFNLQAQVTRNQIVQRLKGQYGDRPTVDRNSRYAYRSFIDWNVMVDAASKGCYTQAQSMKIENFDVAILLYEAALFASQDGKSNISVLRNNPAFFPFDLPYLSADTIQKNSQFIEMASYGGMDDEILFLKDNVIS